MTGKSSDEDVGARDEYGIRFSKRGPIGELRRASVLPIGGSLCVENVTWSDLSSYAFPSRHVHIRSGNKDGLGECAVTEVFETNGGAIFPVPGNYIAPSLFPACNVYVIARDGNRLGEATLCAIG